MIYKFNFPLKPVSLNMAYPTSRNGRRFLSAKGKEFKQAIEWECLKQNGRNIDFNKDNQYISLEIIFYMKNLFTKKGKINKNKMDCSNAVKLLEDSILGNYKIDDCYVLKIDTEQVQSENDCISVILRTHSVIDRHRNALTDQ